MHDHHHSLPVIASLSMAALQKRHTGLKQVELISITTLGDINFNDPASGHCNKIYLLRLQELYMVLGRSI